MSSLASFFNRISFYDGFFVYGTVHKSKVSIPNYHERFEVWFLLSKDSVENSISTMSFEINIYHPNIEIIDNLPLIHIHIYSIDTMENNRNKSYGTAIMKFFITTLFYRSLYCDGKNILDNKYPIEVYGIIDTEEDFNEVSKFYERLGFTVFGNNIYMLL
ncbi:MAG: hypothetical protein GXZ08_08910 [Tissierellia bacterium]|nr:hypothetical protein [Tissierellia bacterium]